MHDDSRYELCEIRSIINVMHTFHLSKEEEQTAMTLKTRSQPQIHIIHFDSTQLRRVSKGSIHLRIVCSPIECPKKMESHGI